MERNKHKRNSRLGYAIMLVVTILLAIMWMRDWQLVKSYKMCQGVVWTTQYNITYESDRKFNDSIQNIFTSIDNSVSMFNKSSLISRINDGEVLAVDSILSCLYKASVKVNKETDGAFDPTVSPLMKAWGFVEKSGIVPDSTEIDSIREFIGLDKTAFVGDILMKTDKRVAFDFSAIAKGFACDEIGRMLSRNRVENYLVEVGGEISLNGVNPVGDKWRVSIDCPIESSDSVIHESALIVSVGSGGIATSGNYRNYMDVDGVRVTHTMNPITGYPEVSNLLSVTIITRSCMYADAYATACMVMGVERSVDFLKNSKDIAAMLIYTVEGDSIVMWSNSKFDEYKENLR